MEGQPLDVRGLRSVSERRLQPILVPSFGTVNLKDETSRAARLFRFRQWARSLAKSLALLRNQHLHLRSDRKKLVVEQAFDFLGRLFSHRFSIDCFGLCDGDFGSEFFDGRNKCWAHAELAKPHSKQEGKRRRLSCHLSAQCDRLACFFADPNDRFKNSKDGR